MEETRRLVLVGRMGPAWPSPPGQTGSTITLLAWGGDRSTPAYSRCHYELEYQRKVALRLCFEELGYQRKVALRLCFEELGKVLGVTRPSYDGQSPHDSKEKRR